MNPHADSVQQPSDEELQAVIEQHWGYGRDNFLAVARAALASFGTRPAAEPSQDGKRAAMARTQEQMLDDSRQRFLAREVRLAAQLEPHPEDIEGNLAARDREADRARFTDPAFNRWMDEGISDAGHTVWDAVGDVQSAWSGWTNRPYYAAEPIQSGSAGEAVWHTCEESSECVACDADWQRSALESVADIMKIVDSYVEKRHTLGAPEYNVVTTRARKALVAALSRQAPAAPAAVDFEQWWLAEVAANGGVPIGADYKHWAKAGFELRGDARAPAAPTQALLGWTRYEKARKLNVAQWAELHQRNLRGENFDDMIDALPATTQPVQQDTRPPMQTWWFKELQEFWESSDSYITAAIKSAMDHIRTAPPAEKQAAPSGEDTAVRLDLVALAESCGACVDFDPCIEFANVFQLQEFVDLVKADAS